MIALVVALGLMALFFAWKWRVAVMRLQVAKEAEERLSESFKALSHDALQENNRSFLDLARTSLEKYQERAKGDLDKRQESIKTLVSPVKETLSKLDEGLQKLEKERKGDHTSLSSHISSLAKETANLSKALRSPIARGRWGEIQLKRVVEMAGMVSHCDFYEQSVETLGDGQSLRPDLIVKLPGGRQVVIDSKVPLESYMDGLASDNEQIREEKFRDHARLVRQHAAALAKKSYHQHFSPTPEFVVLFLPSETFFSAALQYDPSLIEVGAEQGVIIATPTTLIALLRAVAYGWKQENLSEHVEKVSELGHELYKRIVDMTDHFGKMGRGLSSAVDAYNKGIGSLESRVLVSARKFKELGAGTSTVHLDPPEEIEKSARTLK